MQEAAAQLLLPSVAAFIPVQASASGSAGECSWHEAAAKLLLAPQVEVSGISPMRSPARDTSAHGWPGWAGSADVLCTLTVEEAKVLKTGRLMEPSGRTKIRKAGQEASAP